MSGKDKIFKKGKRLRENVKNKSDLWRACYLLNLLTSKRLTLNSNALKNIFVFPNGEKYDGEYIDFGQGRIERSGQGTHYFSNGRIYSGCWNRDKMSGLGEMKYPSGASYKGDFDHNEYNGVGTYTWQDGSTFVGPFHKNKMNGIGEFADVEGCTWIGKFSKRGGLELKMKLS